MPDKILIVSRDKRTHKLSQTDGGVTVCVKCNNGRTLKYPDVKFPDAYIKGIERKNESKDFAEKVVKIWIED